MPSNLHLARALDAVHHLADDDPPWDELLDCTRSLLGTDGAVLVVHRQGSVDVRQTGADPRAVQDYSAHFHAQDLLLPGLIHPPGTWLDSQNFVPTAERQRSGYYTDFMCKHRMRQMGAVVLAGGSATHWATLGFHRERPDDQLIEHLHGPSVTRFLQALHPALHGRRQRAEQWMRDSQTVFATFGEAVLLLNDAGFVIHAEAAALDRLASEAHLLLRQHRLWHASEATRTTLAHAIHRAAQGAHGPRLRLPAPEDSFPVELEFAPAPARMQTIGERLLLLRARFASTQDRLDTRRLQDRFGITHAEARVLAALASGQSIAEHARRHGSSAQTVRKQVAMLMAKMDCTRQVDLVRKALQLAP